MTTITVFQNNHHEFLGFTCEGHAGYADAGEDIVCAGISALVINTVNSLQQFTDEQLLNESDEADGVIRIRFAQPAGRDAALLMKSMVLGLHGIQDTYGNEYLILEVREV